MCKPALSFSNCFFIVIAALCFLPACQQKSVEEFAVWKAYRGDEGGNAYSAHKQIDTKNVKQLRVAWTYRTGDKSDYVSLESSPIIVNNILYGRPGLKHLHLMQKPVKSFGCIILLAKKAKMEV